MQDEIAAFCAALVKDCNCLVRRLEHNNEQMFSGLVRKLVKEGRQMKTDIYGESQQTVNIYADGWRSRLSALRKMLEETFVTTTSIVQAALDALPVSVILEVCVTIVNRTK